MALGNNKADLAAKEAALAEAPKALVEAKPRQLLLLPPYWEYQSILRKTSLRSRSGDHIMLIKMDNGIKTQEGTTFYPPF